MNLYPYSLGLTAISSLTLSAFVLYKNPRSKVNILWSLSCLFCGLWGAFFVASFFAPTDELGNFCSRAVNVSAAYIPVLMTHFCQEVTGIYRKRNRIVTMGYASAVAISLFGFTDFFLVAEPMMLFRYYARARPGFIYFTAHFFVYTFCALRVLWQGIRRAEDLDKKNKIKYIFTALMAGYIAGSSSFLPVYGILLDPFLMHFVWLYAAIISYAILKHRLMDIEVVIKRTIFYTFLTVMTSAGYLIIVLVFYFFVLGKKETSPIILNFIGIAFVAATFKPFEMMLNKFLDKKFFKGSIGQIFEQKTRLESELERAERLKSVGILAAGLAHEIKNPITAIKTFSEYLPQKYDDPEFRRKFSRLVRSEAERISNIVQELLLFAKPSEPKIERCDLRRVAEDICEFLSQDFIRFNIRAKLTFPESARYAMADVVQIKQAILNIVMNAVDAMKPVGGGLIITSRADRDGIELSIQDSGAGIPEDKIAHIFDPFFTGKDHGNGLGLAITHSIIERNGGIIRAQSLGPGKGATFHIHLQAYPANRP